MEDEFAGMRTNYVTVTFTIPVLARDDDEAIAAAINQVQEAFGPDTEVDTDVNGYV